LSFDASGSDDLVGSVFVRERDVVEHIAQRPLIGKLAIGNQQQLAAR